MSTSLSRLWVLGAADPEMTIIESLLAAAGERFVHASADGRRVHPGNAYGPNEADIPLGFVGEVYLVECDIRPGFFGPVYTCPLAGIVRFPTSGVEELLGEVTPVRIDHHRPGDPGYGKGPNDFLGASSLGQVIAVLIRLGASPFSSRETHWTGGSGFVYHHDSGWVYYSPSDGPSLWVADPEEEVPAMECHLVSHDTILAAAAADHCLEAAYRGNCPGVDPDRLMRWRAESRSAFQKRPVEDVLRDVKQAREVLRHLVSDGSYGTHLGYADLRGRDVPELPEAACREGIPYLATVRERDGREKVVLGAAPPELVRRFLAGELVPGLAGVYGDPARGFAGGYISRK